MISSKCLEGKECFFLCVVEKAMTFLTLFCHTSLAFAARPIVHALEPCSHLIQRFPLLTLMWYSTGLATARYLSMARETVM